MKLVILILNLVREFDKSIVYANRNNSLDLYSQNHETSNINSKLELWKSYLFEQEWYIVAKFTWYYDFNLVFSNDTFTKLELNGDLILKNENSFDKEYLSKRVFLEEWKKYRLKILDYFTYNENFEPSMNLSYFFNNQWDSSTYWELDFFHKID